MLLLLFWATSSVAPTPATVRLSVSATAEVTMTVTAEAVVTMTVAEE